MNVVDVNDNVLKHKKNCGHEFFDKFYDMSKWIKYIVNK